MHIYKKLPAGILTNQSDEYWLVSRAWLMYM